ncbi:mycofactocin system transcriptional regulator [Skermania sp. ID1734]|nr:mycofactocin system transcriptional regulator [Skermania sp. ID1734]TSE02190.1 mycofactocin system transcriptional regulator [Skermania sp. ID1734]
MSRSTGAKLGRRPATTKDQISQVGIELFDLHGFDATSVDDIADAAGIARRTFFRYFPSKSAVPWGDFDVHLGDMRRQLASLPDDVSLADGLTVALLDFNNVPADQAGLHRKRMRVILTTPSLQAYSLVMYEGWRDVVAEYVAARTGTSPRDHVPRTTGWLLLGVAMSAYEQWLADSAESLPDLLRRGASALSGGLAALMQ